VAETELPDKLFFKIGEVAQIVGVPTHVLRYWESEFFSLKPMKTRGLHRVYRRRDVELAMLIRRLVYQEGLTIAGARKRLRELGKERSNSEPGVEASKEVTIRAELLAVRRDLSDLLKEIDLIYSDQKWERRQPAIVTSAVPSTVPIYKKSEITSG
jgi:DNA-binding transcriptional MerR regulator